MTTLFFFMNGLFDHCFLFFNIFFFHNYGCTQWTWYAAKFSVVLSHDPINTKERCPEPARGGLNIIMYMKNDY